MRTFDSGAVRDSNIGKGRCDLLPLDVVCDVVNDNVLAQIHKFKEDGDYNHLIELLKNEIKDNTYDDLLGISDRFEMGAVKYGDENWKKGIPASVYVDSGIRHHLKYKRGDEDEPHRIAYMWNILCCIWTCKHNTDMNVYKKIR